jgi:hemin uptake protein HemP
MTGHADHNPAKPATEKTGGNSAASTAIPSADILRGTKEVLIEHEGEIYRLRVTRNGKLILNK